VSEHVSTVQPRVHKSIRVYATAAFTKGSLNSYQGITKLVCMISSNTDIQCCPNLSDIATKTCMYSQLMKNYIATLPSL